MKYVSDKRVKYRIYRNQPDSLSDGSGFCSILYEETAGGYIKKLSDRYDDLYLLRTDCGTGITYVGAGHVSGLYD